MCLRCGFYCAPSSPQVSPVRARKGSNGAPLSTALAPVAAAPDAAVGVVCRICSADNQRWRKRCKGCNELLESAAAVIVAAVTTPAVIVTRASPTPPVAAPLALRTTKSPQPPNGARRTEADAAPPANITKRKSELAFNEPVDEPRVTFSIRGRAFANARLDEVFETVDLDDLLAAFSGMV